MALSVDEAVEEMIDPGNVPNHRLKVRGSPGTKFSFKLFNNGNLVQTGSGTIPDIGLGIVSLNPGNTGSFDNHKIEVQLGDRTFTEIDYSIPTRFSFGSNPVEDRARDRLSDMTPEAREFAVRVFKETGKIPTSDDIIKDDDPASEFKLKERTSIEGFTIDNKSIELSGDNKAIVNVKAKNIGSFASNVPFTVKLSGSGVSNEKVLDIESNGSVEPGNIVSFQIPIEISSIGIKVDEIQTGASIGDVVNVTVVPVDPDSVSEFTKSIEVVDKPDPANIVVESIDVPSTVELGESISLTVEFKNTGDETGDGVLVPVKINGDRKFDISSGSVTGGATVSNTEDISEFIGSEGDYTVEVEGVEAGFSVTDLTVSVVPTSLSLSKNQVNVGEPVTVTVMFTNEGDLAGRGQDTLVINKGKSNERTELMTTDGDIEPGNSSSAKLDLVFNNSGTMTFDLEDTPELSTVSLEVVEEKSTNEGQEQSASSDPLLLAVIGVVGVTGLLALKGGK